MKGQDSGASCKVRFDDLKTLNNGNYGIYSLLWVMQIFISTVSFILVSPK